MSFFLPITLANMSDVKKLEGKKVVSTSFSMLAKETERDGEGMAGLTVSSLIKQTR